MSVNAFLENPENTLQIPNYPIECYYNEPFGFSTSLAHWHFHCEIICIHDGSIRVNLGEKSILVNSGEIIYIHPHQVHEAMTYLETSTKMTLLKFDTSLLLSQKKHQAEADYFRPFLMESGYRCLTFHGINEKIQPLFDLLLKEQLEQSSGFEVRMRNLVCSFVSILADTLSPTTISSQQKLLSENERAQFTKLLIFISDNFNQDNLIKTALDICCLSYSNFAVKFKRLYGKTFNEYINNVRISYAQQLLVNTNNSISQISEQCGYNDACYFSRIFSKLCGISPVIFRQQHK